VFPGVEIGGNMRGCGKETLYQVYQHNTVIKHAKHKDTMELAR
jgi:hypothetical protein